MSSDRFANTMPVQATYGGKKDDLGLEHCSESFHIAVELWRVAKLLPVGDA